MQSLKIDGFQLFFDLVFQKLKCGYNGIQHLGNTFADFLKCPAGLDKFIKFYNGIAKSAGKAEDTVPKTAECAEQRFNSCKKSRKGLLYDIEYRKQTFESGFQICKRCFAELHFFNKSLQRFCHGIEPLSRHFRKYFVKSFLYRPENITEIFPRSPESFNQRRSSAELSPCFKHSVSVFGTRGKDIVQSICKIRP